MTPFHEAFAKLVGDLLGRRWFRERQERQEKQQPAAPTPEHPATVASPPEPGK